MGPMEIEVPTTMLAAIVAPSGALARAMFRNTVGLRYGVVSIFFRTIDLRGSCSGWPLLELLLLERIHVQVSPGSQFSARDVPISYVAWLFRKN